MTTRGVVLTMAAAAALTASAGKKVVSFAWEWSRTTPADVLELQPQIAACGLDGIEVAVKGKTPGGADLTYRTIMQAPQWKDEYFADQLPLLKKLTKLDGLRESYLSAMRMPDKRFSWTDDAPWRLATENIRVIARLAKAAGFVGLVIDHEDYPKQRQFFRQPGDPEMKDLVKLARRRGREMFEPLFAEFPDVKLIFFWFMTENHGQFHARHALREVVHAESLWPFFANGILDALPPGARIIDGNECSYQFKSEDFEYLVNTHNIRSGINLALPENREKYRTQVLGGSALYLEQYACTNSAYMFYKPPHLGSRLGMFQRDLKQALDAADDTVWFWSERNPLVKRDHDRTVAHAVNGEYWWKNVWGNPTWEDLMPGFGGVIRAIKNPGAYLANDLPRRIAAGEVTNLVADGSVVAAAGGAAACPSPFTCWQAERKGEKGGTFALDAAVGCAAPPSAKAEGVREGCFIYRVRVQPAEIYAVRFKLKAAGGAFGSDIGWTRAGGHRFWVPKQAVDIGAPGEDGWREASAIVTVPEGVDGMNVYVSPRQDAGEKLWVDDFEVYRLY